MPVHLAIHPCWSWQCPHCPRKMHFPTLSSVGESGATTAYQHLLHQHLVDPDLAMDTAVSNWNPDHWPRITECT